MKAHAGIFRSVILGFIGTDLIFSLTFVFLFAKVGNELGDGVGRA